MDDKTARDYKRYCERMVFEHGLINNRLSWLLLSQTILFATYAESFGKGIPRLQDLLPLLGIALSVLALMSVVAALWSKVKLWVDVRDLPGHNNEPFWVSTGATVMAALAELLVPACFFFAWSWLLLPT